MSDNLCRQGVHYHPACLEPLEKKQLRLPGSRESILARIIQHVITTAPPPSETITCERFCSEPAYIKRANHTSVSVFCIVAACNYLFIN